MTAKYTLDDLLRVTGECEVSVRGKTQKFFLRTLSATEHDVRQNHASACARALYRKLKDPASAEYQLYVSELDELPRAEVEELVVTLNHGLVLERAAKNEINQNDNPEPDKDATLTEVLDVEEENERLEEAVNAARRQWVEDAETAYKGEVAAMDEDELRAVARKLRVDMIVNGAYADALTDASLHYGVFRDKARKQRLFSTLTAAGEADPRLRQQLRDEYFALDAFALEPDELKNSPAGQPA